MLCCSSFGKFKPNKLIATNSLSSFHRCTRSIAPPVLVLRKPSKSLQPGSCLTRPFRLQLPTLQPMLRPMLLAGPSKLIHKQMWYTCSVLISTHIHTHTHILKHTHADRQNGDAQLWPCWSSDQIDNICECLPCADTLCLKSVK